MVRSRFIAPLLSLSALFFSVYATAQQSAASPGVEPAQASETAISAARDASDEWLMVSPHLPDPKTASPDQLQMAGDVLRARRFPEEAVRYYQSAIERGGDQVILLNRIGVTELDRGQSEAARLYFRQAILLKKKYAEAWNNLGATENMVGNFAAAINDYQRAIKLNRKNATFHANLGTAYFARSDYESGRHEYAIAVKLDSNVLHHGGMGGTMIQVLSTNDRGRFAFEMARIAAGHAEESEMLHWLSVSAESGFDLNGQMKGAKEFQPYVRDERVKLILRNVKAMHSRQVAAAGPVAPLPAPDAAKTPN